MEKEERLHMRRKGFISSFVIVLMIVYLLGGIPLTKMSAASKISVPGKVTGNCVYVRKIASRTGAKLVYKQQEVKLDKDHAVTIKGQTITNQEKWYQITFKLEKKTLSGYMLSDYIKLTLKTPVKAKIISSSSQKISTVVGKKVYLSLKGKAITLAKGKAVQILKEVQSGKQKWFYISFTYNKKTYRGYLAANSLTFSATAVTTASPKVSAKPTVTVTPKASAKPTATVTKKPIITPSTSKIPENTVIGKTGVVTAYALNVRVGAGTSYSNLLLNSAKVQITKGTVVTILESTKVNSSTWYKVSFYYQGQNLYGYVSGNYILVGGTTSPSSSVVPSQAANPEPASSAQTPSTSVIPLTDAQFEAALTKEGFPASYKSALRLLHQKYPLWQFKACKTGYSWEQAIAKENLVGKNLITNSKATGWKSYEKGAYNYATDAFIPFDGSTWVTCSKEALEYYMDPRNFLTTDGIFQFEYLAYEPEHQSIQGVESILKNTVLSSTSYIYQDREGKEQITTYGKTFMAAADYSKVNPFHLATRVKQEVVTSRGLSSSATGNFTGYQGYYNFYNIGAYHSTQANGAIINGLKFAKTGSNMSESNKATFLIPWNSPYNAIVGGAKYIGNNYINRGQNTVYLQKFNLSSYSTFSHQYMANVEAAKSEAQKTYSAYRNFTDIPVVFQIPVYDNMPAKNAPVPSNVKNPNNWLKTLSVTGCTLTPTFKVANSEDTTYTVMVDSETTSVKINATSVSSLAEVDGTGTRTLKNGTNTFEITVTAENGNVRTYILYVIRA